jgi:hypothetical protein
MSEPRWVKNGETVPEIALRWVENDAEGAKSFFGGGRVTPEYTYLGAPILASRTKTWLLT